jgi:hypothetical protein
MNPTTESESEIRIRIRGGRAVRCREMARNRRGEFVELPRRPLHARDLENRRIVLKVATIMATGIADPDEVIEMANTPRGRGRRAVMKANPASAPAEVKLPRQRRHRR